MCRLSLHCRINNFLSLFNSEKPLVLYVFSKKQEIVDKVASQTSSGAICANDTIIYAAGIVVV